MDKGDIMIIGIDFDDTLVETTKLANFYLRNDILFAKYQDYHNLSAFAYSKFIDKYALKIAKEVSLKENAVECLHNWHKQGYKIIVVTARGVKEDLEISKKVTEEYFQKHNIYVDKIVCGKESKVGVCQDLGITIFIDDKESVLNEISKVGIKTLRICNEDVVSKHQIVHNWHEIEDFVKERGERNGEDN